MTPVQRVILCEGYHDRAFWKGLLASAGCHDFGAGHVVDPWGRKVSGGQYAFQAPSDAFIRVVPCHGASRMVGVAETYLKDHGVHATSHLVVNVDPDRPGAGLTAASLLPLVSRHHQDAAMAQEGIVAAGGSVKVAVVRWEVPGDTPPGVPAQQCLERVACMALARVHPNRAVAVQSWLDGRPEPPRPCPKEHSWSFMAGWDAEAGCDSFLGGLWADPATAAELRKILEASGAWEKIRELAS